MPVDFHVTSTPESLEPSPDMAAEAAARLGVARRLRAGSAFVLTTSTDRSTD
jgi:beta-phosphoglucomutase-like phosphatase (HAD superfamily)